MKNLIAATALFLTATSACTQYFPKYSLEEKNLKYAELKRPWYSGQLKALHEPSLLLEKNDISNESYRFLWLRTFHHPVAIRLDSQKDGTGLLTIKMCSGAGGYAPGALMMNKSVAITREQMQAFRSELEAVHYWSLPNPVNDQGGNDGSQWIVEGVRAGSYHVVDRWTPKSGPVRELGETLAFGLAKLDIPAAEIY